MSTWKPGCKLTPCRHQLWINKLEQRSCLCLASILFFIGTVWPLVSSVAMFTTACCSFLLAVLSMILHVQSSSVLHHLYIQSCVVGPWGMTRKLSASSSSSSIDLLVDLLLSVVSYTSTCSSVHESLRDRGNALICTASTLAAVAARSSYTAQRNALD